MSKNASARTNIVLIGFMGAGKSTVGRMVAEKTGRTFVDVDQMIEDESGMTISSIFALEHEAGFRKREQTLISLVAARGGQVIACGGGAVTVPANVRSLRKSGLVIYLAATPEIIFDRIKNETSGRPLIASGDPFRAINKLFKERERLYEAAAHTVIDTSGMSPEQGVGAVIEAAAAGPGVVGHGEAGYEVNIRIPETAPHTYTISIRRGLLGRLGDFIGPLASRKVFLISDRDVSRLYGEIVVTSLAAAGIAHEVIVVPSGEETKDVTKVASVYRKLVEGGAERGDLVCALGGGVVGDLAGFVAATYQRGIPFVQVPTTLLAQVDSSIGGKTGVNLDGLKNMIGAFHQPLAVFIDPDTLSTLPRDELLCGIAEIIKAGFLDGGALLGQLESSIESLLEADPAFTSEMIALACAFKARVVETDEQEAGERRILNYGHTLAHALEAVSDFGWRHGHAVSVGMVFASRLGVRLGFCDLELLDRQTGLLGRAGLPIALPEVNVDAVIGAMKSDKKVTSGKINFVFVESPGRPVIAPVEEGQIREELQSFIKGGQG